MPIWLRRFTFNTIKEHFDKRQEAIEEAQGKMKSQGEVQRPGISPNYSTKKRK